MVQNLTEGRPLKLLFFFALPMVAGNLFQQLYNTVDSIVVGKYVGDTALAAVEEGLRDYVALHELVHFLHPNHGPGFYATMDSLMPGWQERRRALKAHTLTRPS